MNCSELLSETVGDRPATPGTTSGLRGAGGWQQSFAARLPALLAVVVACLAWVALPARAAPEQAAVVHFATGYVAATAAGQSARPLARDDAIYAGDRVDTADNGRVQMRFTDGGLVALMPNSTFAVDDYLYEAADDDARLVFGLLKGGLRTMTGAIGKVKHDQYELKTPVATLGIRGTEYTAVLRPANTLRVHVGRGKVVITNDQGSLEVPEGRNAIVVLGKAPAFSEEGPNYMATGPAGDRLDAGSDPGQDPHLLDPLADMPLPGDLNPLPSDGLEYITGAVSGFEGYLFTGEADIVDPGTWTSYALTTRGALTWGEYTDGTGTIAGNDVVLSDMDYLGFVSGTAAPSVPQGTLSYTLDGATAVRSSFGDVGTLDRFDLDIDVGSLNYSLDFEMTMASWGSFTANVSGGSLTSSNGPAFAFSTDQVVNPDACPAGGSSCNLDVEGFLAGSQAEQAGVSWRLGYSDGVFSGAAGLKR